MAPPSWWPDDLLDLVLPGQQGRHYLENQKKKTYIQLKNISSPKVYSLNPACKSWVIQLRTFQARESLASQVRHSQVNRVNGFGSEVAAMARSEPVIGAHVKRKLAPVPIQMCKAGRKEISPCTSSALHSHDMQDVFGWSRAANAQRSCTEHPACRLASKSGASMCV